MWNWVMENFVTQMLVKKSLFVTNKVFCEIIVTMCRFAYLHTVTASDKPRYRLKRGCENFAF